MLLIAVVGIWGTVLYRVMNGIEESTPDPTTAPDAQVELPDRANPRRTEEEYQGRFRDPFAHALGRSRSSAERREDRTSTPDEPTSPSEPTRERPLRLQLVGIVETTALLKGGTDTYLVHEGDSVSLPGGRVTIQEVYPRQVVVRRGELADTLRLSRRKWTRFLDAEDE